MLCASFPDRGVFHCTAICGCELTLTGACAGPNTLVGLAKPADAGSPFDHDNAIKALLPAYSQLLSELKALGVPEAQLHEPILATTDAAKLKAEFQSTYGELSKVGLPINLVSLLLLPRAGPLLVRHMLALAWYFCLSCPERLAPFHPL